MGEKKRRRKKFLLIFAIKNEKEKTKKSSSLEFLLSFDTVSQLQMSTSSVTWLQLRALRSVSSPSFFDIVLLVESLGWISHAFLLIFDFNVASSYRYDQQPSILSAMSSLFVSCSLMKDREVGFQYRTASSSRSSLFSYLFRWMQVRIIGLTSWDLI